MNTRQNSSKRLTSEADLSAIDTLTFDFISATRVWQWLDKKFSKLNESISERFTQIHILLADGKQNYRSNYGESKRPSQGM